jgi:hypothetical protein
MRKQKVNILRYSRSKGKPVKGGQAKCEQTEGKEVEGKQAEST